MILIVYESLKPSTSAISIDESVRVVLELVWTCHIQHLNPRNRIRKRNEREDTRNMRGKH
jgi:hypothetical protein